MRRVERKGTVWLLQMTAGLSEKKKLELLTYVSRLERSEEAAFTAIEQLSRSIEWVPKVVPERSFS